jgi:polyhydroxybutyrate depolymerase
MGGGMTQQLACKAADVFAAGAPSSFDLTKENTSDCSPARPISMFLFRGMSDAIVPFAGGPTTPPTSNVSGVTVTFYGAQKTFQTWGMLDGCTDQPKMVQGDSSVMCQGYSQCKDGVEVVLCTNGGGHAQGPAAVLWGMLKKHGLKGPVSY